MPLLYAILVAVLLIALIVSLVFAAKHWHWLHITAVVLVFLTAVPAVYYMSFVMKTRVALVKAAATRRVEAEQAKDQYDAVLYGAEAGVGGGYGEGSRNAVLVQLKRLNLGKGRVWDNATINSGGNNQYTFGIPLPTPAEGEAAADPQQQPAAADTQGFYPLASSMIFVFEANTMNGSDGQRMVLPGNYLGSFRVGQIGDQQVTATGETVVDNAQNGASVYIYEKPPTDFHGNMYRGMGLDENNLTNIDIEAVRTRFQEVFPFSDIFSEDTPENQEAYTQLMNEVSFDRRPLSEIREWLGEDNWTPDPQEMMVKVKVKQQISEPVNGNQDIQVNGEYDSLGRTNIPNLKLENDNATIPPAKGDETWMVDYVSAVTGYTQNEEVVQSLQEKGEVEVLEEYYYRPLRDYTTEISLRLRDIELMERRLAEYQRYAANSAFLLEQTKAQEIVRDEKISQLTVDQQNLKRDLQVLTDYTADVESRLAQLKRQMRDTYLQISYIHQQQSEMAVPAAAGN